MEPFIVHSVKWFHCFDDEMHELFGSHREGTD